MKTALLDCAYAQLEADNRIIEVTLYKGNAIQSERLFGRLECIKMQVDALNCGGDGCFQITQGDASFRRRGTIDQFLSTFTDLGYPPGPHAPCRAL